MSFHFASAASGLIQLQEKIARIQGAQAMRRASMLHWNAAMSMRCKGSNFLHNTSSSCFSFTAAACPPIQITSFDTIRNI